MITNVQNDSHCSLPNCATFGDILKQIFSMWPYGCRSRNIWYPLIWLTMSSSSESLNEIEHTVLKIIFALTLSISAMLSTLAAVSRIGHFTSSPSIGRLFCLIFQTVFGKAFGLKRKFKWFLIHPYFQWLFPWHQNRFRMRSNFRLSLAVDSQFFIWHLNLYLF